MSCKECRKSMQHTSKDCGHHLTWNGVTDYDVPSDTCCDKYGNCMFYEKYITNFEKIKSMTKEQLATFLSSITDEDDPILLTCNGCMNYGTHHYEDRSDGCADCEYYEVGNDISKWLDKEWEEQKCQAKQ